MNQASSADYTEVCRWVLSAWQRVQTSTIVSGFQKCGITESNDSSSSEEEGDNIDDQYQDIIDMLAETDSDTSFNGFEEHSDVDNTGNDD